MVSVITKKIRVLAIAPYPGLEKLISSIGREFPDIEIFAHTGDLETGLRLAADASDEDYDFILSRGGTADLIEKRSALPVIRIPLSGYDYMRALKLASTYPDKTAVVGFPDISRGAFIAKELLDSPLDIFTIHSPSECDDMALSLKRGGYKIILGGTSMQKAAAHCGLNAVLITSGSESVHSALKEIMHLSRMSQSYMQRNQMLQAMLDSCGAYSAAYDSEGRRLYSNLPSEIENTSEINWLSRSDTESKLSVFSRDNRNWQARAADLVEPCGSACRAVYCREIDFGSDDDPSGITVHNLEYHRAHMIEQVNLFSSETLSLANTLAAAEASTLIIGEPGTGKNIMAHMLHLESPRRSSPFVQADCRFIDSESFGKLLSGKLFPSVPKGSSQRYTLYLKALDRLPLELQTPLCTALEHGNPFANCVIIASAFTDLDELALTKRFYRDVLDSVAFSRMRMPPLRERRDDIPGMLALLISRSNERYGKQFTGITTEACRLVCSYDWLGNTAQLMQVFDEIAMTCPGPDIDAESVRKVLNNQSVLMPESSSIYHITEDRTLDEMERDIIRIVLEECGGNQSIAAARLGIGRSTLWRKLKPDEHNKI